MYVTPFTPAKNYVMPCFIVHASDRFVTIRSELGDVNISHLERWVSSKRVIYSCVPQDTLTLYGDEKLWTMTTWNGRVSRMRYGMTTILPLSTTGWDESLPEFFASMWALLGVTCSSLNTLSLNLWRTTLTKPVSFQETSTALLGPIAVGTGGRKEANRGTWHNMTEYDISAAYPHAMLTPLPGTVAPVAASAISTLSVGEWDGVVAARVRIPPQLWGPIPLAVGRNASVSSYGHTGLDWRTVTLPLSEVQGIESLGCDVSYIGGSVGPISDHVNAFGKWGEDVLPVLRNLPGLAGQLGKTIANRLWSSFAISSEGERHEHTFRDGRRTTVQLAPDSPGRVLYRNESSYVGAIISSRVRQRVYSEGLSHFRDCVYVDTDGVIAPTGQDPLPGWRIKTEMRTVEIASEQTYRYTCTDCLQAPYGHLGPHYVVAGGSDRADKSRIFRLMRDGGFLASDFNQTVPKTRVVDGQNQTTQSALPFAFDRTALT